MAIGKREQIVGISIAALAAVFVIHILIFKPRADAYAEAHQKFSNGVAMLTGAEVLSSDNQLLKFNEKTTEYEGEVTSVVKELNLTVPDHFTQNTVEGFTKRVEETNSLVKQLVELRTTVRQPVLSFLDNRPAPNDPLFQTAWNFPQRLPEIGAQGAVLDLLVKLADRHTILNSISDPTPRMQQRAYYNQLLQRLGINPHEVSDWVAGLSAPYGYVYFNDSSMIGRIPNAQANPYSLARFGVAVPALKKLWMHQLLSQRLDAKNSPITKERLGEILETGIPLDDNLLVINKQLQALIDVIRFAERNQVLEISRINLMKPTEFAKTEARITGKTPTPAPTPAGAPQPGAMGVMGAARPMSVGPQLAFTPIPADQKVGIGTGLEIWFRATNPNMVKFLFDIGTAPRTYSTDDLHIQASPDGILNTSATIELMIKLDNLKKPGTP